MREFAMDVLREVCASTGISMQSMTSNARDRQAYYPRQRAYYEIFVRCPHMSLSAIGRMIGSRDHTTVLHGIRTHAERIGSNYEAARERRMVLATRLGIQCSTFHYGSQEKRFKNLVSAYGKKMREATCAIA